MLPSGLAKFDEMVGHDDYYICEGEHTVLHVVMHPASAIQEGTPHHLCSDEASWSGWSGISPAGPCPT